MAETSGLLNRRTGFTGTEGSNPSVSAITYCKYTIFCELGQSALSAALLRNSGHPNQPITCLIAPLFARM